MPNLTLKPAAKTPRKRRGRRGARRSHTGHAWLEAVKVVFLLQRHRSRSRDRGRSSPSLRQIALVVVSGGILLVIVRVATHRGKSHTEDASPPSGSNNGSAVATDTPVTDPAQDERSDAVRPDA